MVIRILAALLALMLPAQAGSHEAGHAMHVAAGYAASFEGLAAEFRAMGYITGTPGCLSAGHMHRSKHHWGGACDLFDQVARNRTALRQPPPAVQIAVAARHGLTSGCVWRSPDCGHFEVPSAHGAIYYGPVHRYRRHVRVRQV